MRLYGGYYRYGREPCSACRASTLSAQLGGEEYSTRVLHTLYLALLWATVHHCQRRYYWALPF